LFDTRFLSQVRWLAESATHFTRSGVVTRRAVNVHVAQVHGALEILDEFPLFGDGVVAFE
jgi:hypothetical protein